MHRALKLSYLTALLLATPVAFAAPRDNAANKKIDEAINQHYLAMDFKMAEAVLVGTIKACENQCSPEVLAKAWMYAGVVRGSGKKDPKGAQDAFQKSLAIDPKVKLDEALATPETKTAYEAAAKALGVDLSAQPETPKPEPGSTPATVEGDMDCTPTSREIETRRRVPVSCTTEEEAVAADLRYKDPTKGKWISIPMSRRGDRFEGEVPCGVTMSVGKLELYVRAKDAAGDTVDNWGSKRGPVTLEVKSQTEEDPPAFPGKAAPDRCPEPVVCPPGMEDSPECVAGQARGDKGYGDACDESLECQAGLACINGTCETAPSCTSDDDCAQGICVSGICDIPPEPEAPQRKLWVGLHFGYDLAIVGGDDVCTKESQDSGFACFEGEQQFSGSNTLDGQGGKVNTGVLTGTQRVMLSGDYFILDKVTLGARLGYAFGGGPEAGGFAFMPFHLEARGALWPLGLGRGVASPYVHLGGGMAQVDAFIEVPVRYCRTSLDNTGQCPGETVHTNMEVYRKLGQGFVGAGGGIVLGTETVGAQLNFNFMYMLPTSGLVIEPSLGAVVGF